MAKSTTKKDANNAFDVIDRFRAKASERKSELTEKLEAAKTNVSDIAVEKDRLKKEHAKLAKSLERDRREYRAFVEELAAEHETKILEHAKTDEDFQNGKITFAEFYREGVNHSAIVKEAEETAIDANLTDTTQ